VEQDVCANGQRKKNNHGRRGRHASDQALLHTSSTRALNAFRIQLVAFGEMLARSSHQLTSSK
jgi:hypothetical protein